MEAVKMFQIWLDLDFRAGKKASWHLATFLI